VREDVAFGPRNLGLSEDEISRRVEDALLRTGLDPGSVGDRSPFELSGGQRRRVALAGVLAMEPTVLILDEPTAGLDPEGRADILSLLLDLRAQKGTTLLMISHNMDEVACTADRVLVMSHAKRSFSIRRPTCSIRPPCSGSWAWTFRSWPGCRRRYVVGRIGAKGLLTLDAMQAFVLERAKGGAGHAG
jgi:energy-coupling factor transporter ATP-binding protein EcfA2